MNELAIIRMYYENFLSKEEKLKCKLAMDYNFIYYKYIPTNNNSNNNFCNLIPIEVGEGHIIRNNVNREEIFLIDEIQTERFKVAIFSPKVAELSQNNSKTIAESSENDRNITADLSLKVRRFKEEKWANLCRMIKESQTIYRIFAEPYKSVGKEIESQITLICKNTGNSKEGQIEGGAAIKALELYPDYKTNMNGKNLLELTLVSAKLERLIGQQQRMIDRNNERNEGFWNFILKHLPFLKIKKENKERLKTFFVKSVKVILTISGVIIISTIVYKRYYKKQSFSNLTQQTIELITPTNSEHLTEAEAEKLIKLFAKAKGVKIYEWRHSQLENYLLQLHVGIDPKDIIYKLDSVNNLITKK